MFPWIWQYLPAPTPGDEERLAYHQLALKKKVLRRRVLQTAYEAYYGKYLDVGPAEALDRDIIECPHWPIPHWLRHYLRQEMSESFRETTRSMAPMPWRSKL